MHELFLSIMSSEKLRKQLFPWTSFFHVVNLLFLIRIMIIALCHLQCQLMSHRPGVRLQAIESFSIAAGNVTGLQDKHEPHARPREFNRQQPRSTEPEADLPEFERSISCSQEWLRDFELVEANAALLDGLSEGFKTKDANVWD